MKISLGIEEVEYEVKKSGRNRHIRLTVNSQGKVLLSMPRWVRVVRAEEFLRLKARWVVSKIREVKKKKFGGLGSYSRSDYLKYKEKARKIISLRVNHFCDKCGFKFNKIAIKNQKTCWGSCSRRGNLNLNFRLMFLEEGLMDYVIVHELAHTKEMNHSKRFWKIVESIIPDFLERRKELRKYM